MIEAAAYRPIKHFLASVIHAADCERYGIGEGKRLLLPLARINLGHKQRNCRVQILVVDPGEEPSEYGDAEVFRLDDEGEVSPLKRQASLLVVSRLRHLVTVTRSNESGC